MLPELAEEERLDETALLLFMELLCETELLRDRELLPDFDPEEPAKEDVPPADEELAVLLPVAEDKLL